MVVNQGNHGAGTINRDSSGPKSQLLGKGLPASLSTPRTRLTAIVEALTRHYDKQTKSLESRAVITEAKRELKYLLSTIPSGIVYLTQSAKEGVYALNAELHPDPVGFGLAYAIKRFATFKQAEFVPQLIRFLSNERQIAESRYDMTYFATPEAHWPLKVNGYSVVFFDAVVGEDLSSLMPKIDSRIREGDNDAELLKNYVISLVLDNLAFWQSISPKLANDLGYEFESKQIRNFLTKSLSDSASLLERITAASLTEKQKGQICSAGDELSLMAGLYPVLGRDAGPRNIMVRKNPDEPISDFEDSLRSASYSGSESKGQIDISRLSKRLIEVDLPFQPETIHRLRDPVRFLFSPSTGLTPNQAIKSVAYQVLKTEYLSAATPEERTAIGQELGRLHSTGSVDPSGIYSKQMGGEQHDLHIAVIGEAARMNFVIPAIFLPKLIAELNGEIPRTSDTAVLEQKYQKLDEENKGWAATGAVFSRMLANRMPPGTVRDKISGLELLFRKWEQTPIKQKELPRYHASVGSA